LESWIATIANPDILVLVFFFLRLPSSLGLHNLVSFVLLLLLLLPVAVLRLVDDPVRNQTFLIHRYDLNLMCAILEKQSASSAKQELVHPMERL
jgi:hypothetical protein